MKALKAQVAAANAPKMQEEPPPVKERKSTVTPGRIGKKAIVGHFSAEVSRRLARIAFDEETTMQALVGEGLDAVFKARGLPPVGGR